MLAEVSAATDAAAAAAACGPPPAAGDPPAAPKTKFGTNPLAAKFYP